MPADRPPRRGATVRFRITALAALAFAAVLVLTGVGLVAAQRRILTENLDESLGQTADSLAEGVADGAVPRPIPPVGDDDAVAQVVVDGEVVAATATAAEAAPLVDAVGNEPGTRDVDGLPTDRSEPYRVLVRQADGPDGTATIVVAAPLDDINDSTGLLARSLLVTVPVVTALLALLVWWLVGRTLRPVEAMRREAAGIGGTALDRRVPEPAGDDEVARLARTLNAMLGRIEASARRQQRFVADASHELRSPLARIRAELEVDLAHPAGADPAATSRSVLAETIGMQSLVDDLLVLARRDAGPPGAGRHETVDLDEVVAGEVRRLRAEQALHTAAVPVVDTRGVGAAQVSGDPARLGRALGNVLDNAVRHARTSVTVTLAAHNGVAVLAVADDGSGIPADRRDDVFERFTRLDDARAVGSGGTGLGLAIAREIVVDHGGTIAVDPDHHPGARLVISLPAVGNGAHRGDPSGG
jgi:signal transduction histidine kinase